MRTSICNETIPFLLGEFRVFLSKNDEVTSHAFERQAKEDNSAKHAGNVGSETNIRTATLSKSFSLPLI